MNELNIESLLRIANECKASDVHITVGTPISMRVNGKIIKINDYIMLTNDTRKLLEEMLDEKQMKLFMEEGDIDFSYSILGVGRFRGNAYKQRDSIGISIRIVALNIPTMEQLSLPSIFKELTYKKRGLILVTGPTGSGKSTTLASMINYINENGDGHVITIEDPIEYLHKHKRCLVNQREVGKDTVSFAKALRAALRQDPDTILVGEMRDLETIGTAITAAETGHLVLSTLHTIGAAKTIDRIIDVFPPYQQQQIRVQLASVLEAVISQQLLPTRDGKGRCVALEILIVNSATRSLIREGKTHQIQNIIQTGTLQGMVTMDASLINLYSQGKIDASVAEKFAVDLEYVKKQLSLTTSKIYY